METSTKKGSDLNIWAFWKAQKPAWRVTVVRTSLERFGYKLVLPYLSLYVILMGATKTQLGLVTSLANRNTSSTRQNQQSPKRQVPQ